ncbi:alpha/beta fold hydrolase [Spirosoma sp. KUDC1026]|uniref:alpha/beta fold hydrolase n=1 Tax=Spirosoma sp. KUDC1026 TaxID=2745947 RepID=UPI00159BC101|nr:alpha/beta hydrolase [Spirosoma sp. KUDC1026]QKZ11806.1 alpha/beta hydrolase [Spirosoma sp. KUDC1026]
MKRLINGVNLNVLEQGSGALTLVFLHYFGGSALEWQAVMNQLADEYKCVAIDLRGCGDSDATETGYSVEDMADDVAALIQDLSIDQFVLVGHSMSGKVVLQLASRQPKGLRQLLLVSPSPPRPEPIPDKDRQEMLAGHGQRSAAEQTFEKITVRPVSDEVKEQIIADNLRTSTSAWNAWLTLGSKEDIADQMVSISVPAAIIVGSDDKALAPEVQPELTIPYLKNVTIETIEEAGHLLPWETPDELAAFIRKKIAG